MSGILCSMVGASFTVAAAAEVLRSKKGITAVGNAQVDTAQSKFGGASALFDGTGDYLTVSYTDNTTFEFTTGEDFTIECWFRGNSFNQFNGLVSLGSDRSGNEYILLIEQISGSNYLRAASHGGGNLSAGTTTISTNTWYHAAVTREGTTVKLFLNGNLEDTDTRTFTAGQQTTSLKIGSFGDGTLAFNGHIDEVRISNTARYTATFTPSTTPFVNDANTLLLIHANGTDAATFFEDDNGARAPKGISANGNAQVDTAQSYFGGASALFDGTGDYLIVDNIADGITEDQTFEFWIRFADLPASSGYRMVAGDGSSTRYLGLFNDSGTYRWEVSFASGQYVERFTTSVSTGVWYHVALTKSAATLKMYQAGTALTSAVSFNTMTAAKTLFTSGTNYIGSWNTSSNFFNGHMDEIRVSNNVRYTTTFTPSTTPFVNDSNTVLLIHADGTDASTVFRDDNGARTQQSIQVNGNAQTDTAISKFGGSSLLLDGTGDAIQCSDDAMRFNASANRTIEFWIYSDRNNAIETLIFQGVNTGGTMDYWQWFFNSANLVLNIPGSSPVDVTITRSTGTWYHFAWVKQGNSNAVYWNGTSVATFTKTDSDWGLTDNNTLFIGYQQGGTTAFDGNIDEFRISSSARYTANFTPSTTPFQSDANTVLLLHMDGTDGSTVFFDDNGIAPYTP